MLNPNNPIAKVLFLLLSLLLICIPCCQMIKETLHNFKSSKIRVKILKVLSILIFSAFIFIMICAVINRIMYFNTWYIGGSNL